MISPAHQVARKIRSRPGLPFGAREFPATTGFHPLQSRIPHLADGFVIGRVLSVGIISDRVSQSGLGMISPDLVHDLLNEAQLCLPELLAAKRVDRLAAHAALASPHLVRRFEVQAISLRKRLEHLLIILNQRLADLGIRRAERFLGLIHACITGAVLLKSIWFKVCEEQSADPPSAPPK